MEFKKPTSYSSGRPELRVPQRGGSVPDSSKPTTAHPVTPPANATARAVSRRRWSLPTLTIGRPIRRLLRTKTRITMAAIVVVGAGACIAWFSIDEHNARVSRAATTPAYPTVLPVGKSVDGLGGWQRISPPEKDPVFAYADVIDGVAVTVSQQPLPASFKDNVTGNVAELAKKFNATTEIDTADTTVYVGTSAKGPQSAILAKNNVLILIKSQKKIDDNSWAKYTQSLIGSGDNYVPTKGVDLNRF